jgi:hypothetical protein
MLLGIRYRAETAHQRELRHRAEVDHRLEAA